MLFGVNILAVSQFLLGKNTLNFVFEAINIHMDMLSVLILVLNTQQKVLKKRIP